MKELQKNALKIMKETRSDAVKLESNKKNFKIIKTLTESNIPVMGHIGYTPQFKKNSKSKVILTPRLKNF